MTLTPLSFLIVCPLLFLAGFVDSIVLGGCCITGNDPQKECAHCGFQFLEVDEKEFKD